MATSPVVPAKNIRRVSHLRTVVDDATAGGDISDDLIDVWEHAVTLYQAYEWQDAVCGKSSRWTKSSERKENC